MITAAKVLITGCGGQLGQALLASLPPGMEGIATTRASLDLADGEACRAAVRQHQPAWVLNAGAYTAVDRAESEPDLALRVNAGAPEAFAEALADRGKPVAAQHGFRLQRLPGCALSAGAGP